MSNLNDLNHRTGTQRVPVRITLAGCDHTLESAIMFGKTTKATDVSIVGDPGATIRSAFKNDVLLVVGDGSPPIHLSGVRLLGRLRVEDDMDNLLNL
eukprot:4979697-Prymnesium_polylepis.1